MAIETTDSSFEARHRERMAGREIVAARDAVIAENRTRLRAAFADLRARGFLARQNFMCCGGCAGAELARLANGRSQAGRPVNGAVYYHAQDAECLAPGASGKLRVRFGPLSYCGGGANSTNGTTTVYGKDAATCGRAAVNAFRWQGLAVSWGGDPQVTIEIDMAVPAPRREGD